jgi:mutator protein MutT
VETARALRGVGLAGDRYAAGRGFWRDDRVSRDLTLVAAEVAAELVAGGLIVDAGELRRNVVTRGVDLNSLRGETFWIGDVACLGTELCEPCRHLDEITGKPLLRRLVHRGGLRARLVGSGTISVGAPITQSPLQRGVGVVVARDGEVLLGRRSSAHGYGTWSFPGGKANERESAIECAVRELREETGLVATAAEVVGETLDAFAESRAVFRTTFVSVTATGEPQPLEPDKTAAWEWHAARRLPQPLFAPVASFCAGVTFAAAS